jgi:hypothetical protein
MQGTLWYVAAPVTAGCAILTRARLSSGAVPIEIEDDLRLLAPDCVADHQGLPTPTSCAGDPSSLWLMAAGFGLSHSFVEQLSGSDHGLVTS